MKKYILTYLFILFIHFVYSQEWYHSTWDWLNGTSTSKMIIDSDTILPSLESGKKLIEEGKDIEIIKFEKDTLVYLYDGEKFDTLYYFTARVGKSWSIKPKSFSEDLSITVKKKGDILIDSYTLGYQVIDYELKSASTIYTDTVVQLLGNLNNHYIPIEGVVSKQIDFPVTELNCYINDTILYNRYSRGCNYSDDTLSAEEYSIKEIFVYPNPAQTSFVLNVEGEKNYHLQLLDVTGKVVLELPSMTSNRQNIDISHLENGIYFLKFINSEEQLTGCIVVAR